MDIDHIKDNQIIKCPNCGNKTSQKLFSVVTGYEVIDIDAGEEITAEDYYFTVQCSTCREVSLLVNWEHDEDPTDLSVAGVLYPVKKNFRDPVPEAIAKIYNEAKKIEKISPISFAVMGRKVIESIAMDRNAKGKDLKQKIKDLAAKNIIPDILYKMSDAVRVLGNLGAHDINIDISSEEAKILDEFMVALIEYVYIAPKKIEDLIERIRQKKDPSVPA